jgi:hypothetical protein
MARPQESAGRGKRLVRYNAQKCAVSWHFAGKNRDEVSITYPPSEKTFTAAERQANLAP